ncbi:MAG: N-acetylmuramoyl-L-alanine amidase [Acutalibacteraceae bacterium]
MKKERLVFIIICLLLLVSIGTVVFLHSGDTETIDTQATFSSGEEEAYLLSLPKEKAPESEDLIFLTEGIDCSFEVSDKALKSAADTVCSSFMDGVILKSTALSGKNAILSSADKTRLSKISSYIKNKGKKVYIFSQAQLSSASFKELSSICDGIIVGTDFVSNSQWNALDTKLTSIKKTVSKEIILYVNEINENVLSLTSKSFSSLLVSYCDPLQKDDFINNSTALKEKGISLCPLVDFSFCSESKVFDEPLKALYEVKQCQMNLRAFSSYSFLKENEGNCFGAVRTYISEGIVPLLAFRDISVTNYSSEKEVVTTEGTHKIQIKASYLYPVYLDGKNIGIFPKGIRIVEAELNRGENSLKIKQNGSQLDYKVIYRFEGKILSDVTPRDEIKVSCGETVVVTVIAYHEADVFVKLGANKISAVKEEGATGYTVFTAKFQMPLSVEEIYSLGRINVIGNLGDATEQLEGAKVTPAIFSGTSAVKTTAGNGTSFNIENYTPTIPSFSQNLTSRLDFSVGNVTAVSNTAAFTGNQMAVVATDYADTKPPDRDDDSFVPTFTPLVNGTMDYVIGESKSFDTDENEWHYYYDLACGMKIARDQVILQPAVSMQYNTMAVTSSYSDNGQLTVRLKTDWKIPYSTYFSGQEYYTSSSKAYYISDYTQSGMAITFYYTASATGEIDCSGSDVIAGASWTVSDTDKTATLHLPFKTAGSFYGFSLRYEGSEMVLTFKNTMKGLSGSVVVLDPGHGYDDSGATGFGGIVKESDINLLVAYQAKAYLEAQGVTVYMTRYGDDDINLEGRKTFGRTVNPDLFVSIHSNAADNSTSMGVSAFYYRAFSKPLAENIFNELVSVYKNNIYAGQQDLYDDVARGTKYYPFSVTRIEDCPSTLVEIGFMTNDSECYILAQTENQELLGKAIAQGICNTLTQ